MKAAPELVGTYGSVVLRYRSPASRAPYAAVMLRVEGRIARKRKTIYWQSFVSGNWHHGMSPQWWASGDCAAYGKPWFSEGHGFYDRRYDEVALGEVENIVI
jgi:hypothetical protein